MIYATAIPLAFLRSWIAGAGYILVAIMWLIPDPRIERKTAPSPEGNGCCHDILCPQAITTPRSEIKQLTAESQPHYLAIRLVGVHSTNEIRSAGDLFSGDLVVWPIRCGILAPSVRRSSCS